jgi:hypothetical protein
VPDFVMKAQHCLILLLAALGFASLARGGHEQPVYPSYYPHEIEISALPAQQAGSKLAAGELHAYVGHVAQFDDDPPKDIDFVPSLGSFLVVSLNPASAAAENEASACAALATVAHAIAGAGADVVAHPYPVTPWHGDYLHHADLAQAAKARIASGGNAVRVRAPPILAQRLARPEWAADGSEWDVSFEEVDARQLVAGATTHVNGWSGPGWARSGWFHAYLLLAGAIADPQRKRAAEAIVARLQSGAAIDPAQRINLERDLVQRLTAGCRAGVAGFTVKREPFNRGFSSGVENIAYDSLEGLSSPMFIRTVKLKDFPWNGWLKLGTTAAGEAAWNPIGGFRDEFGRLLWFAVGDPAAIPSPYDHGWVVNRITEVEATPRR